MIFSAQRCYPLITSANLVLKNCQRFSRVVKDEGWAEVLIIKEEPEELVDPRGALNILVARAMLVNELYTAHMCVVGDVILWLFSHP